MDPMKPQLVSQGSMDEGCFVNMVSPVVSGSEISCKGIQSSCETDSNSSGSRTSAEFTATHTTKLFHSSPGKTGISLRNGSRISAFRGTNLKNIWQQF
ncbi:unnamed protein product [Allacma fusca]|uniref:Uncharacterized protein n=1 Tax=Allacma fusca TaxID=39272 RepID=A0A8J2LWY6_9HEXA|nr:unnamed protein product [Allacma fusca]